MDVTEMEDEDVVDMVIIIIIIIYSAFQKKKDY